MAGHVVGPRAQGNPGETVDSQFDPDTMLSMSWELLFPMAAESWRRVCEAWGGGLYRWRMRKIAV